MNLRVGITALSPGWEQLLRREGVPFRVVDVRAEDPGRSISLLVVSRELGAEEAEAVDGYLRGGGAVLAPVMMVRRLEDSPPRRARLDYLAAEPGTVWAGTGLLDLAAGGWIPREANGMRTQDDVHALFAGPWRGGHAVLLPFDPGALLCDARAMSRRFHDLADRLPAERVSTVGKGALHHLLHAALRLLHHVRGLSYAHLWHFPDGRRNIFAFRVDSDAASAGDVDDLYRLARGHGVPLTWFLDVRAHEDWLHRFAHMEGQEFGVHCYEHVPLVDPLRARPNLERAHGLMRRAGLEPRGFAAPYGMWSPGLAEIVDGMGFPYASEFSFAYDTLPLYAETALRRFAALQVPVHPVGVGSLRRAGYTPERMLRYFDIAVGRKLALGEPLIFYHHPTHRHGEVLAGLFRRVRDLSLEPVLFGEYARWWKERERQMPAIEWEEAGVRIGMTGPAPERFWIRMCLPDGRTAVVPPVPLIRYDDVCWQAPVPVGFPGDLRRIRDFDPRAFLGALYAALERRMR